MLEDSAGGPIADEQRFRLLVEAVIDYAIYMLDPTGRVVSWNAGAQRFKGYTEAEILGHHFSRFYTDEDRAAGVPAGALRGRGLARAQGRRALLGQRRHRPDPQAIRRARRLRQGHARPDRPQGH